MRAEGLFHGLDATCRSHIQACIRLSMSLKGDSPRSCGHGASQHDNRLDDEGERPGEVAHDGTSIVAQARLPTGQAGTSDPYGA